MRRDTGGQRFRHHSRIPFFRGLTLLIIACSLAACDDEPNDPGVANDPRFAVGINVDGLAYYGTEVAFLNSFKLAAPWFTQCNPYKDPLCRDGGFVNKGGNNWNTREQDKLDLDSEGYPRSLPDPGQGVLTNTNFTTVSTLVPTGLNLVQTSGRFVVLHDGEGTLEYAGGAVKNGPLSTPGRDVLDIKTDGRQTVFQLSIRVTDPRKAGNHIRNIRALPGGTLGVCSTDPRRECDASGTPSACGDGASCLALEQAYPANPFHPRFLKNLKDFRVIRLMSMQNTNNALTETWEQRTRADRYTWVSDRGDTLPVEVIAALGNQAATDLWVNMPTHAGDDYIRQFATLLRQQLKAERRVYVEYSNEAWNTIFAAGTWMQERAQARWPDASDPADEKRLQWYGMRSAQVCDIWKEAWAGDAARVVCVISTQAANPRAGKKVLDCPLWAAENGGTPCHAHRMGAMAIAPYFGFYIGDPRRLPALQSWTAQPGGGLESLFAEIFDGGEFDDSPAGGSLAQARQHIEQNVPLARERGLELVGYEGGQHLVGLRETLENKAVTELFMAANRDPRMGEAYRRHLDDWREAGGGLYNLWLSVGPYSIWGSWGLLEYRDQGSSPKYDAVMQSIPKGGQR